ncbi:phage tail protein [Escherichia coli]|uniref:phage tail protein n=1 Tax=Escherichia coli TaxID=562 RepID=UPI003D00B1DF
MPVSCYLCIFLNVGLGEGSALPVGVPVPWPSETPPTGWLKCNGAPFSAEEYPKLAKAYPTNKLPDLRGEFLRGWDDGRGVDSGRALMSAQGDAIRNITGNFGINVNGLFSVGTGVFDLAGKYLKQQISNITSSDGIYSQIEFDASRQIPTASENRPRNIAFNFIVRAA